MRHPSISASPRQVRTPLLFALYAMALLLTLTLGSCTITLPAVGVTQGSGTIKTETRSVSDFTSVTLSGIGTLNIQQTGTESLTITSDDNLLPLMTSTVSGGVLILSVKSASAPRPTKDITWNLSVKSLTGITLSGAGTINVQNLHTTSLTALVSGAGSLNISGDAPSQTVTVSGVGNYRGRSFTTANTTVTISGTGSAIIAASATLNATVSGAGSVTYYGTPQVTKTITGVGSVKQGT